MNLLSAALKIVTVGALFAMLGEHVPEAAATATQVRSCIHVDLAQRDVSESHGILPDQAKALVEKIAKSISLPTTGMTFLNCALVSYAEAYYEDGRHGTLPQGEYIAYNSVWIRQVAGQDQTQIYALLGHELGHFLGRHFSRQLSQHDMELEADAFAGCAVARMHGDWTSYESLMNRLRGDVATDYPSADESIEAGKRSFEACGGDLPIPLLDEDDSTGSDQPVPPVDGTDSVDQGDAPIPLPGEANSALLNASKYQGWLYVGFYENGWDDPNFSGIGNLKPEDLEGMSFSLARGSNLRDGPFRATTQLPNGGCRHQESKIIGGLEARTSVTVAKVYRLEGSGCRRFVWAQVSPG